MLIKQCLQLPFVASQVSNGNQNSVYNYIWSTFVDNIDVFDCCLSGVVFVVCFMILRRTFYLELLLLERKVYNNEDITFLSVYYRLPSPHLIMCGSDCNTLSHKGLANVSTRKRMFYPLNTVHL